MNKIMKSTNISFKIAVRYFLFGLVWCVLSDNLLILYMDDNEFLNQLYELKEIVFVIVSSSAVYFLARHFSRLVSQKEKCYRRLLDNMVDSVYLLDKSLNIVDVNVAACTALGYNRDEVLGRHLCFVNKSTDAEEWFSKIMGSNESSLTKEGIHKRKDGSLFPVEISVSTFSEGNECYSLGIARDITGRKRTQELMIQNEKMSSLGSLVAGIAHEINNPLSAILGAVQNINNRIFKKTKKNIIAAEECSVELDGLQKYMARREIDRMIKAINESGIRASRIVNNMLRFSHKGDSDYSPCSLPRLLNDTIDLISTDYNLMADYDFKQIIINRNYSCNLPPVYCSSSGIQLVLMNIIKNATEAVMEKSYPGHSRPTFDFSIFKKDESVVLEIADNGSGIDEEIRTKIFEPFFTSKAVGKGTGLGLSIAYSIITEQHNGQLEVQSSLGKGSVFSITLPVLIKGFGRN